MFNLKNKIHKLLLVGVGVAATVFPISLGFSAASNSSKLNITNESAVMQMSSDTPSVNTALPGMGSVGTAADDFVSSPRFIYDPSDVSQTSNFGTLTSTRSVILALPNLLSPEQGKIYNTFISDDAINEFARALLNGNAAEQEAARHKLAEALAGADKKQDLFNQINLDVSKKPSKYGILSVKKPESIIQLGETANNIEASAGLDSAGEKDISNYMKTLSYNPDNIAGDIAKETPSSTFTYKIANVKTKDIKSKTHVAINYAFKTASGVKNAQIIFNNFDDQLASGSTTIDQLYERKDIFIRPLDKTTEWIDQNAPYDVKTAFADYNLSIKKDLTTGEISLYTSLTSDDQEAQIARSNTTTSGEETAVEIGYLESSASLDDSAVAIDTKILDGSSHIEETINPLGARWEEDINKPNGWADSTSTVSPLADHLTLYMKSGSVLTGLGLTYDDHELDRKTLSIQANDDGVTIDPSGPIYIDSSEFKIDEQSLEINYSTLVDADATVYGKWYKIEVYVGKKFHITTPGDSDIHFTIPQNFRASNIFLTNPFKNPVTYSGEKVIKKPFQKHVDEGLLHTVLYDIYSAWDSDFGIDNLDLNNVSQFDKTSDLWKGFNYTDFKYNTDANGDEILNTIIKSFASTDPEQMIRWTKMSDAITALNDYYNTILDIEEKYSIDDNREKNYYKPIISNADESVRDPDGSKLAENLAGIMNESSELKEAIELKINKALDIYKLTYREFLEERTLWKNNYVEYKRQYDENYDSSGKIKDESKYTFNFDDVIKDFPGMVAPEGYDRLTDALPMARNFVHPTDPSEIVDGKAIDGKISIEKYAQEFMQEFIPSLFAKEYEVYKANKDRSQSRLFIDFLNLDLADTDPTSIVNVNDFEKFTYLGVDLVTWTKNANAQVKITKGYEIIENYYKIILKTNVYKNIFITNDDRDFFVKEVEDGNFWNPDSYGDKNPDAGWVSDVMKIHKQILQYAEGKPIDEYENGQLANILNTDLTTTIDAKGQIMSFYTDVVKKVNDASIFESLSYEDKEAYYNDSETYVKDEGNAGDVESAQGKVLRSKWLQKGLDIKFDEAAKYKWVIGHEAITSEFAHQIISWNIRGVIEYLRDLPDNADLKVRLEKLSSSASTPDSIAQLGPKLHIYKMQEFISDLFESKEGTKKIVYDMMHSNISKVLIPNLDTTNTFVELSKASGTVVQTMAIVAGTLITLIGGILMLLSFTKRFVTSGSTWTKKLVVIRVILVVIIVVGFYLILKSTVLDVGSIYNQVLTV